MQDGRKSVGVKDCDKRPVEEVCLKAWIKKRLLNSFEIPRNCVYLSMQRRKDRRSASRVQIPGKHQQQPVNNFVPLIREEFHIQKYLMRPFAYKILPANYTTYTKAPETV